MRQMGFEPMKNSLIHDFDFSIWLRSHDRGESMFDMELTQELFEPSTIELGAIVCDDGSWKAIMAY